MAIALTSAQEIQAPDRWPTGYRIFMAGTIDQNRSEDWQTAFAEALDDYDVVLLNPRRDDWDEDASDKFIEKQIGWEQDGMEAADFRVFVFLKDSKSPITFMELGQHIEEPGAVMCPEGFYRKINVDETCERAGMPVLPSMEDLVKYVKVLLDEMGLRKGAKTASVPYWNERTSEDRLERTRSWVERNRLEVDSEGRALLFHATPRATAPMIEREGLREGSILALDAETATHQAGRDRELKGDQVVCFSAWLPIDSFHGSTFATTDRTLPADEISLRRVDQAGPAAIADPALLYHCTSSDNRASILEHGLLRSMSDAYQSGGGGGIFFDSKLSNQTSRNIDTWQVDVSGLELEPDETTDVSGEPEWDGHQWWVLWDRDVEPERLKLVEAAPGKTAAIADPTLLYHGTYRDHLASIMNHGLEAAMDKANSGYESMSPHEITHGHCYEWAMEVAKYFPEAKVKDVDLWPQRGKDDLPYHVWVEFQGKSYDAETPQGVSRWRQLPYFKEHANQAILPRLKDRVMKVTSAKTAALATGGPESPGFEAWFGDSLVVDEQGQPLMVHRGEHGGYVEGQDFQTRSPSVSFGDRETARTYAESPNRRGDIVKDPRVYGCYLRIVNPVIDDPGDPFVEFQLLIDKFGFDPALDLALRFAQFVSDTGVWYEELSKEFFSVKDMLTDSPERLRELYMVAFPLLDDQMFVEMAKAKGYDGAIHGGWGENGGETEYQVFDQNQVRCTSVSRIDRGAAGNNGEFNMKDKKITAATHPFTPPKRSFQPWYTNAPNEAPDTSTGLPPCTEQTSTEEFKGWFGRSQVVDVQGTPLVCYHGTSSESKLFVSRNAGVYSQFGYWFDASPASVERYMKGDKPSHRSNAIPVYLRVEKPKEFNDLESFKAQAEGKYGATPKARIRKLRSDLGKEGFDGAVIRNSIHGNGSLPDFWVAFDMDQIKSALGNSGEFSESMGMMASLKLAEEFGPLYHGSPYKFEVFRTRRGPREGFQYSMGAYFTDDLDAAKRFAWGPNGSVRKVTIEMDKPLDLSEYGEEYTRIPEALPWLPEQARRECRQVTCAGMYAKLEELDKKYHLVPRLKRRGYDGIIFEHSTEGKTYVAFYARQIKDIAPGPDDDPDGTPEPKNLLEPLEFEPKTAASHEDELAAASKFENEDAFLKSHNTGWLPSNAYAGDGMFTWQKVENNPKLLKTLTLPDGRKVSLRQDGKKLQYCKYNKEKQTHYRDEKGDLIHYTDDEIQERGWPLYDTAIMAFNEQGECVGQASDEWGADLVAVRPDFQNQGLGTKMLAAFREQYKKVRRMGQMTNAGENLAKSYWRYLMNPDPRLKIAAGPACTCGHPISFHQQPPDFGCSEEKNGCKCLGFEGKTGGKQSAVDYLDMFAYFLSLQPNFKDAIEREIRWAKTALKKSNRIVWWLRWVRLGYAMWAPEQASDPAVREKLREYHRKLEADFAKQGSTDSFHLGLLRQCHGDLEHLYSMDIPEIEDFEPGYQDPILIMTRLKEFEREYTEKSVGTLVPKPEDKIFLDCGNGWAWWFLPRASCSDEAKAMGHCGNSPEGRRKDRAILSLRENKAVGNQQRLSPHCTFILHTNPEGSDQGVLGEMKGRQNAKPVPKYYPMITRLLEDRRIQGVIGGGYLPAHNFSFDDLSPKQQEAVHKANPDAYFTWDQYIEKKDIDVDAMAAGLELDPSDTVDLGVDGMGYSIATFDDAYDIVKQCGEEGAKEVQACVDGSMELFADRLVAPLELESPICLAIVKHLNREFPERAVNPDATNIRHALMGALRKIDDGGESELRTRLEKAFMKLWRLSGPDLKTEMRDRILESTHLIDGLSGELVATRGGGYAYAAPARMVVELFTQYGEHRPEWGYPYVMITDFNEDRDREAGNEQEAIDILAEEFPVNYASPRALENRGQGRLFERPQTDEQAEREGFHVSSLLEPRTAAFNYTEMFTALAALEPRSKVDADREIAWAKRVLKKQSRIVWYLRWYRWAEVNSLAVANDAKPLPPFGDPQKLAQLVALDKRYCSEMHAASGSSWSQYGFGGAQKQWSTLRESLDHFFGLPDFAIEAYDPGYKAPEEVLADLHRLEAAFKERAKGTIAPHPEDSIFLDCGNGWAWWLMPRAYDEDESECMGHCGNSPARGRNDLSILSLRKKKDLGGGDIRWEPHLTFILHQTDGNDTGTLGEMKGRNNDKPVPAYHAQIMQLLKDERIKGIDGGGYLPEHNFAPKDLTKEQREEVKEANPAGMMSIREYSRNFGWDETLTARVASRLNIQNVEGDEGYVIESWDSYTEFIDDCGDQGAKDLAKYLETGGMEFFVDHLLDGVEDEEVYYAIAEWVRYLHPEVTKSFRDMKHPSPSVVQSALSELKLPEEDTLRQMFEQVFEEACEGFPERSRRSGEAPESLNEYMWNANDAAMESDYRYAMRLEYKGKRILQVFDYEQALEAACEGQSNVGTNKPYVSVDLKCGEEESIEALKDIFNPNGVPEKSLEQSGQGRLFDRPETDEEAERDGIRISKLLKPKRASATPARMALEAERYKDQFPTGHPGFQDPETLHWKDEPAFDLHRVAGFDNGDFDLYGNEMNEDQDRRGPEGYLEQMYAAIGDRSIEPVILAEGTDGGFYVWDGNHRVGMARTMGVDTMPAWVGYQRTTPTPQTGPGTKPRIASRTAGPGCNWRFPLTKSIVLEGMHGDYWDFTVLVGQFADKLDREIMADVEPGVPIPVHYMPTEKALKDVAPWGMAGDDGDDRGEPHIEELMKAIKRGVKLPPCLADEGGILDGRHRIHAASRLGIKQVPYILLEDTLVPEERTENKTASPLRQHPDMAKVEFSVERKGREVFIYARLAGFKTKEKIHYLELEDEDVAGMIGATDYPQKPGWYRVGTVGVANEFRGTGLGQILYEKMIQALKETPGALFLTSGWTMTEPAQATWRRLRKKYPITHKNEGFKEEDEFGFRDQVDETEDETFGQYILDLSKVPDAATGKTAFVSPRDGEVVVAIDLGARPRVSITLDLGIPNFSTFKIAVPIDGLDNSEVDNYVRQAFDALLDHVAAFLVSMKFNEDESAQVLAEAQAAFIGIGAEEATDAHMPNADRDVRLYEANFRLPEGFIDQTRSQVVTAGARVKRSPDTIELELTPIEDLAEPRGPGDTIEMFRDQSTRSTPRAFLVQVVNPKEESRRHAPRARDWESRLLQPVA